MVISELNSLRSFLNQVEQVEEGIEDIGILLELASEEEEHSLTQDLQKSIVKMEKEVDRFEVTVLLSEKYDVNNAILSLHAGAGGTESQDWVQMLYRMYNRWAELWGYKLHVTDLQPGDEAGIKSATMLVQGENAYGFLKSEKGVHRLVRISPFDSSKRRHT